MSTMNTYTGKEIDPMHMQIEDLSTEDIAHALSLLCRGNGHLIQFYSVAMHSINCANEAKARGYSRRVQKICLLHDASEAYLSDVIRPVKPHLTNYLEIEDKIMNCIWKKYNLFPLSKEEQMQWKQIDDDILQYEMKHLMIGKEHLETHIVSNPDISNTPCTIIEKEFINLCNKFQEQ